MGESVERTSANALRERRIGAAVAIAVAPAVLLQTFEALGLNERLAAMVSDSSQSFAQPPLGAVDLIARAGTLCLAGGLVLVALAPRLTSSTARAIASIGALVLALGFCAGAGTAYVSTAALVGANAGDVVSDTLSRYFAVSAIGAGLLGIALIVGALPASPLATRSRYAAHGLAAAAWIAAAGGIAGAALYGFVAMKALWGVYFVATPIELARHALQGATAFACIAMALGTVFTAGAVPHRERVSSAA